MNLNSLFTGFTLLGGDGFKVGREIEVGGAQERGHRRDGENRGRGLGTVYKHGRGIKGARGDGGRGKSWGWRGKHVLLSEIPDLFAFTAGIHHVHDGVTQELSDQHPGEVSGCLKVAGSG